MSKIRIVDMVCTDKKTLKKIAADEEDFPEYQANLQDLYFQLDRLEATHKRTEKLAKKLGYLK